MRILSGLLLCASALRGATPAFPGAEGFGADTPGGRGGAVIAVTNLDDSGPGSFRAACEANGPRIVVFRVGGLIDLKKNVVIKNPNITIAAQTAPGDGICLRDHQLMIDTHDVVLRYLRSRPGDIAGKEVDAISIAGSSRNVIADHCSATWSVDEALSPSGDISNITVQWCLIAEGLNKSVHKKGAHGYGSLVRASGGLTLHHNLWRTIAAVIPAWATTTADRLFLRSTCATTSSTITAGRRSPAIRSRPTMSATTLSPDPPLAGRNPSVRRTKRR
jgi:hypothetical protein